MNCKTNTIIIIECQRFQYPLYLVLIFYHSPYIPNPNTCKAVNNISIKNQVNDVRRIKLKSFLTTLLKLKSKLIILSSHRTDNSLPSPDELCKQFCTASVSLALKSKLAHSVHRTTACQVLTNCSNDFTQQIAKASHLNHKEKFLHHKGLNMCCGVTITKGVKIGIRFMVYGSHSQVIKNVAGPCL